MMCSYSQALDNHFRQFLRKSHWSVMFPGAPYWNAQEAVHHSSCSLGLKWQEHDFEVLVGDYRSFFVDLYVSVFF